jgi:hypothetical protein
MNTSPSEVRTSPAKPGIWKWLRRLLLAFAVLATIIAALITIENVHGNRKWERFKKEAIARGKHLDTAYYIPANVPDDENFGAIPLFAPLFSYKVRPGVGGRWDSNAVASLTEPSLGAPKASAGKWRAGTALDLSAWQLHLRTVKQLPRVPEQDSAAKEVLLALGFFDNRISELRTASVRPFSRFPLHYEEGPYLLTTHAPVLKHFSRIVQLRALAHLANKETEEAASDTLLCLRLAESIREEPLMISQLNRAALLELALQPVWEGLARRQWTKAQLQGFQMRLAHIDLLSSARSAMLCEENWSTEYAGLGDLAGKRRARVFSGYFNHNRALMLETLDQLLAPAIDSPAHRVFAGRIREAETLGGRRQHFTLFFGPALARMIAGGLLNPLVAIGAAQTAIDQARIACALEMFRQDSGGIPPSLEALAPKYLASIPNDVITGKPMHYRLTPEGTFILYSVGLNEKDDGGRREWKDRRAERVDLKAGDWVWSYPQ